MTDILVIAVTVAFIVVSGTGYMRSLGGRSNRGRTPPYGAYGPGTNQAPSNGPYGMFASQMLRRYGPRPQPTPQTKQLSMWINPNRSARQSSEPARFAASRELKALVVRGPTKGRVLVGSCGRRTIAVEPGHSLLVVGPTQSGKTTGLAAPAIREWEGPVIAASVKGDLARSTMRARKEKGEVLLYDPLRTTGLETATWSPLQSCGNWAGARRTAADLAAVAREQAANMNDGDFWYSMAAKLLAPLFLAAHLGGHSMADVVCWIDEQDLVVANEVLSNRDEAAALQALRATIGRDDRQRSAVFTTAETVVEAFADPDVAASAPATARNATNTPFTTAPGTIEPTRLLGGNNTLYLCAPAQDQRRLRALFATLVTQVIAEAYGQAMSTGRPLDPPLLVVLDEAANVAPLAELDVLASTAAGHGVQLVTVWQDLAQLNARYGALGSSVVNNHRAKLFLSGIADPGTLEHASQLAGDEDRGFRSTTIDQNGSLSTTDASQPRRLLPPDALRRLTPGSGLLLYAHLPPIRVKLRKPSPAVDNERK